jgi:hypothetical protein
MYVGRGFERLYGDYSRVNLAIYRHLIRYFQGFIPYDVYPFSMISYFANVNYQGYGVGACH